jgi:hypothetical protein
MINSRAPGDVRRPTSDCSSTPLCESANSDPVGFHVMPD